MNKLLFLVIHSFLVFFLLACSESTAIQHVQSSHSRLLNKIDQWSWQLLVDSMDRYITEMASYENIPGLAYSIVRKDTVLSKRVYGLCRSNSKDSIQTHTTFRLASISKCFAGALAAVLDRKQMLDLDTPLIDQLGTFKVSNDTYNRQITLRQTLNHSTGLVEYALAGNIRAKQSREKIYQSLRYAAFESAPGDTFAYQNAIFSVISTYCQQKLQRSFTFMLDSLFFSPLGMSTASVGYKGLMNSQSIAYPHTKVKGRWQSRSPEDRWYNVSPAAGVNASIDDMVHWVQALLGGADSVLTSADRSSMYSFDIPIQADSDYYETWSAGLSKAGYGLGLRIMIYKGVTVVYHGGWVRGYRPEMVFIPEKNIGFVFLCNTDKNELSTQSVPHFLSLIDHFIGFE